MPAPLRNRNAALLFKIESTEGVDASPVAGTDAVLVEVSGAPIAYDPALTQTNEVTGSLDPTAPIVGGVRVSLRFSVYAKGSGVVTTAPEISALLRCCGWVETITSSAVPAAPAALTTGTTTTATLGAAAATTAQIYRGMPLAITGASTLTSFIADYTAARVATLTDLSGTALGASHNYQVLQNVRYSPASGVVPSGTAYYYLDGVLHRVYGCRGDFTLVLEAAGAARFDFNMTGIFGGKIAGSVPAATYQSTRPPIFRGGAMLMNRAATPLAQFTLNGGNALVYPPNPNSAEGFDAGFIAERRMTGALNPHATLVADGDPLADLRNATPRILHARFGSVAGNRFAVTVPAAQYTGANPGDRSGLATDEIAFFASGQDAGALITFW